MKKDLHFALCIFLIMINGFAYGQNWLWAKSAGGNSGSSGYDRAYSVTTDQSANVFVTGCFQSPTIIFGSTTLINKGGMDFFIAKYDAMGNVLWAKSVGGTNDDIGWSVSADAHGNVFVTGSFTSPNISFDSITLTNSTCINSGCKDAFIAKYDALGNVLWAKGFGGNDEDEGVSVSADYNGNVYLTGNFGTPIAFGTTTLTNPGMFLVKYDAIGNVLWAKNAIGNSFAYSVSADINGNVCVTGGFTSSSITFSSIILTQPISTSVNTYIVKYDMNGNALWAKNPSGGSYGNSDYGNSISTDGNGNVLATGAFYSQTLTFGSITLMNTGSYNVFFVKYDPIGNVLWAKAVGGNSPGNVGYDISTDAGGNVFLTGDYFGTIIFGSDTIIPAWKEHIFLAKLDPNGNLLCASSLAIGDEIGMRPYRTDICTDPLGNAYLVGMFSSNPFIVGSDSLIPTSMENAFVAKWECGCSINASVHGNTTICSGQSTSLIVPAGGIYSWSNGSTSNMISVAPTSTSSYSVIVSKGNCSDTAYVTVTVLPQVIAGISGNTTICSGQSTTLTASGGGNYFWNNAATTASIVVSPTSNTTYSVSVSNGICSDDTSITITVNPLPPAFISGNKNICPGQTTTLIASGGTYLWNNGSTNNSISVSPSSTTSYSVIVTGANGCSNTAVATTTITPTPVALISPNSTICSGSLATLNASGGANYVWNTGATTSSINVNPNASTNYSVIVSNGNCSDTAYTSIIVKPNPTAHATSNIVGPVTSGQSVTLNASGGISYSWSNGYIGSTIVVFPTATTKYCVTATDTNNCTDTACVTVVFYDGCVSGIYLPNAFSPNNDGENDFLQLHYESILCITFLHIEIYNRWGEKIYESNDPAFKWDGIYNTSMLKETQKPDSEVFTYYLNVKIKNGNSFSRKGNISLMR